MLDINTCEPVFVSNLQQGSVYGRPYKDCMYENGKMHMEIMHIFPMNLFMQECDNLAPDIVQGISSWHLAKWSLSVVFKAVQPAFKISLFVFRQSQTLCLQFAFSFLKTPNVKNIPVRRSGLF